MKPVKSEQASSFIAYFPILIISCFVFRLLVSCEMPMPIDEFFNDQTSTVTMKDIQEVPGMVAVGEGGVLCVNPAYGEGITITLDNPGGLSIAANAVSAQTPAGVSLAASHVETNAVALTVSGAAAGHEFPVNLELKTAREGRQLAARDWQIAFVEFETRLSTLTITEKPGFSFAPASPLQAPVADIDPDRLTLQYLRENPASEVIMSGTGPGGEALLIEHNPADGEAVVHLSAGSNTVTVRVSAAYGAASRDYTLYLTRNAPQIDAKRITSFTLAGTTVTAIDDPQKGVINDTAGTINVKVRYGVDITSQTPGISHTSGHGTPYSPTTAQDFTTSKTYTVTAVDGTTKTYTVTVEQASLSSISIARPPNGLVYNINGTMDFSGMGISGADSAGNIFDLITGCPAALPAGFSASYDFANPGTRPVTVTHNSQQTVFYVTVNPNAKDITSLKVGDTWGVISGTNITVTLPYNSTVNLTSVTPIVAHTGAGYSPTTAQDFTGSKTYTVTASDNTTKTYTVTVQKAALSSIAVTAMPTTTTYIIQSSANTGINYDGMVITGTDSVGNSISLLSAYSGGTIVPTGFTASYNLTSAGSKLVTLTHTASGKQATFSVTVAADGKDITSFKVGDTWGVISGTTITVTLPYNSTVNLTSVTPIVAHTGASHSPTTAQDFSGGGKTYTVTAADGNTKNYTVTVQKASLSSIAIGTPPAKTIYGLETAANTGMNYNGMVITGVDSIGTSITLLPSYTGVATVPSGFSVSGYDFRTAGNNKAVTLTHTASGKTAVLYMNVRDFALLSSLSVTSRPFSSAFTPATLSYSLYENLPNGTSSVTVEAAAAETSPAPAITGKTGSQNVNVGANSFTVTVTPPAGYGAAKTYTITVNRKPPTPTWGTVYSGDLTANLRWYLTTTNVTGYEYYTSLTAVPPAEATAGTATGNVQTYTTGTTTEGPRYFWVRALAGTVKGDWSAVKPMIIGRTYPTDYDLKTAVEAGGTIYLGPYSGSSGSPYDVHNTNSWNIPAGKSTTIIPATGLIQIYVKHVNNYFPITAQLGSSLILGGMTAEFDNRLEIYGDGKDGTANPNGVINCLGSVTMNRGVMIWDYRSNLEGIVWVHGSGLFVFNAGAVINNCRSTQYIIYRSTGDTNAHSINGGGTFWNNSSSSGDANWG